MREYRGSITYKNHVYMLVFNLNVMEEIQHEYGTVETEWELTGAVE